MLNFILTLLGRSAVFERMFQTEMKESKEGRVLINDMEPKVLKEMLYFMYYGAFSDSDLEDAMFYIELFKASHKYEIKSLRTMCTMKIAKNLDFNNAGEIYTLGKVYAEPIFCERGVVIIKQ